MTTNLALPLAQWTLVTNGVFGAGPAMYADPNAVGPQRFYCIQSP